VATGSKKVLRHHHHHLGRVPHRGIDSDRDRSSVVMVNKPRPFRIWYVILTGFLSILITLGLLFGYIWKVSSSQRADTCEVVMAQLAVFHESPSNTDTGRRAEAAWERLRHSLKCDEVKHDA
jgi:hypothetical protein